MKKGFTLAEVLITLAIIGVVAALTIPSVILNTNQTEYRTGLKKAVSVLNQAVSLELATENVSPSEATSASHLVTMVQQHMNTIAAANGNCAGTQPAEGSPLTSATNFSACGFTTTDGMQFAAVSGTYVTGAAFNGTATLQTGYSTAGTTQLSTCITGSTTNTPCYFLVDVNGDKAPNKVTVSADAPSDRFYIMFGGANGTTITPAGWGQDIMFK